MWFVKVLTISWLLWPICCLKTTSVSLETPVETMLLSSVILSSIGTLIFLNWSTSLEWLLPPSSRSLLVHLLTTIGGIVFWLWGIGRLNCGIFISLDNGGILHGLVVENGGCVCSWHYIILLQRSFSGSCWDSWTHHVFATYIYGVVVCMTNTHNHFITYPERWICLIFLTTATIISRSVYNIIIIVVLITTVSLTICCHSTTS